MLRLAIGFCMLSTLSALRSHGFGRTLPTICPNVSKACTCDLEANNAILICNNEFTLLVEFTENVTLHMSYYNLDDFRNVPYLGIDKVAKFDIDAYRFWNETTLPKFLNALGVNEVEKLEFRDRVKNKNNNTWHFGEINGVQSLKVDSGINEIQETIFDTFVNLTRLKIGLDVNFLPDKLLANLTNLRHLMITNQRIVHFKNKIMHNNVHLINVTILIGEVKLKKLDPFLFANLTNLREVNLIHAVAELSPEIFSNAVNLRRLRITENDNLVEVPTSLLKDQINLRRLDLHSNGLKRLPEDFFATLAKLEYLDLSCNKIDQLTSVYFEPLKSLKQLNLNFNPLTNIEPTTFAKTTSLNLVDMRATQFYGGRLRMDFESLLCTNDEMCNYRSATWSCSRDCICWVDRPTMQLIVQCGNSQLDSIPSLPNTTLVPTVLKFESNQLEALPNATDLGYANVTRLYLSNNNINSLEIEQLPPNLTFIDVSNNKIERFSDELIEYLSQSDLDMTIKMSGNPLICDCATKPLLNFVRSTPYRVTDLGEVRCASSKFTKSLQQMDTYEICPSNLLLIVGIVGGFIVLLCLSFVFYLWYEQPIKIWLYNHNLCLWYVSEEELDKDKIYDAFISYSHRDEDLVVKMLPKLEGGANPFKICLHGRDWLVGDCIPERIVSTIEESKRIIIILSQNFIDSVWTRMEFRIAYQAVLEDKRKRIIIILYKEIEHMDGIGSELKAYLKLNTYLKWGDPHFWSKLRYAMPHNKRMLKGKKSAWESHA